MNFDKFVSNLDEIATKVSTENVCTTIWRDDPTAALYGDRAGGCDCSYCLAIKGRKVKRTEPHWYLQTQYECPVCGNGELVRERIAGPKPQDRSKRYDHIDRYCGCLDDWSMP